MSKQEDIAVLKEVNQILMKMMINYPHFESRAVTDLNEKVCKRIRENRKEEA